MATPTVYKSNDAGAPVLFGSCLSLIDVLDACLVNGYGGTYAVGAIVSDASNTAEGETVTVGARTYTFRASPAAAGDVLLGASAAASLTNLAAAINLYNNSTLYHSSTLANADVRVTSVSSTTIALQARMPGVAGNALALSETSAHLTVTAFAGGTAGSTKTAAGWTKDYSSLGRAIYRPASGTRCYLDVIDNNPDQTYYGSGARIAGLETVSALGTGTTLSTGTGPFGNTYTMNVAKTGTTPAVTTQPWILIADGATAYLWYVITGTAYYGFTVFGDFHTLVAGDTQKSMILSNRMWYSLGSTYTYEYGGNNETVSNAPLSYFYLERSWSGISSNQAAIKGADYTRGGPYPYGGLTLPHAPDGGLYLAPIYIFEGSVAYTYSQRGYFRGLYVPLHPVTSWNDGDTIPGSGTFAGHTFLVVKGLNASDGTPRGAHVVDITDWPT